MVQNAEVSHLGDTTSYLEYFQSLAHNKSLVPLECQQPGPTENKKSPKLSVSNATFDCEVTPSETPTASSKSSGELSYPVFAVLFMTGIYDSCKCSVRALT